MDAKEILEDVLILVLVEDGLGADKVARIIKNLGVLILVLVEDGLGVARFEAKGLEIFQS